MTKKTQRRELAVRLDLLEASSVKRDLAKGALVELAEMETKARDSLRKIMSERTEYAVALEEAEGAVSAVRLRIMSMAGEKV